MGLTRPFAAAGLLGLCAVDEGAATGLSVRVIGGRLTGTFGGGVVLGGSVGGGTTTVITGGGAPTAIMNCVRACVGVALTLVMAGKLNAVPAKVAVITCTPILSAVVEHRAC